MGHREDTLWRELQARITSLKLGDRIMIVDDLDHDEFLTALSRSTAYVRTAPADGVSSSVLEALTLPVPVVTAGETVTDLSRRSRARLSAAGAVRGA